MLAALDIRFLVRDLQSLIHARIDKIYEDSEDPKRFLFRFRSAEKGKQELFIHVPNWCFLTTRSHEMPTEPPKYCMFLRKHIQGGTILSVEQSGMDRIIIFRIRMKEGTKILIIELFSKGNVILCKEDMTIISALENQSWSTRTIRGGVKYTFPPVPFDPITATKEKFTEKLLNHKRENIVKGLAMDCALGGDYAEELLERARVKKDVKAVSEKDVLKLYNAVKEMVISSEPGIQEGIPVPLRFSTKGEFSKRTTFSEAIDETHSKSIVHHAEEESKKETTHERKWRTVIETQETRKKELLVSSAELQTKGEFIYANYAALKEIMDIAKPQIGKGDWKKAKELLESQKQVKKVDLKTKTVELDV
ncbi:MAG: NFACT family protein [Candidatus Woesearchaeota archaeon]